MYLCVHFVVLFFYLEFFFSRSFSIGWVIITCVYCLILDKTLNAEKSVLNKFDNVSGIRKYTHRFHFKMDFCILVLFRFIFIWMNVNTKKNGAASSSTADNTAADAAHKTEIQRCLLLSFFWFSLVFCLIFLSRFSWSNSKVIRELLI